MIKLDVLPEPMMQFGNGQEMAYSRTGLSLFGPYVTPTQATIRLGYIGPSEGLGPAEKLLSHLMQPLRFWVPEKFRVPFPGFEAVFNCSLPENFTLTKFVNTNELLRTLAIRERTQRIFKAVEMYLHPLERSRKEDDEGIDLWIVYVPDVIAAHCRPNSHPLRDPDVSALPHLTIKELKKRLSSDYARQFNLFEEDEPDNVDPEILQYKDDFRHQLKFRLLHAQIPIQILRQNTVAVSLGVREPAEIMKLDERKQSAILTHINDICWNLSTTLFYKCCGTPWKLADLRPGVCYVGLVFKRTSSASEASRIACCAAQMFLDSGDGIVFKGTVGPWYSPERKEFHLSTAAAQDLVEKAVHGYRERFGGQSPRELFIHGKTFFSDDEWGGFTAGVPPETKICGVRIKNRSLLRFYPYSDAVALRGLSGVIDKSRGVLVTNGWIPRMQTYPGREIPIPLTVDIVRGESDIKTVLDDVFKLTKLNYNTCVYGDGLPVTLRFADSVGSILTAGPGTDTPPLPFKFYI